MSPLTNQFSRQPFIKGKGHHLTAFCGAGIFCCCCTDVSHVSVTVIAVRRQWSHRLFYYRAIFQSVSRFRTQTINLPIAHIPQACTSPLWRAREGSAPPPDAAVVFHASLCVQQRPVSVCQKRLRIPGAAAVRHGICDRGQPQIDCTLTPRPLTVSQTSNGWPHRQHRA